MIPRECDNDDCDYNEKGQWEHVEGCDGPMPVISEDEARELIRKAPPGSFLATTFGPALLGESPQKAAPCRFSSSSSPEACVNDAEPDSDYCIPHAEHLEYLETLAEAVLAEAAE